MAARFQVLLTKVRHIGAGHPLRDERTCPELVLDAYTADTAEQVSEVTHATSTRSFRSLANRGGKKQDHRLIWHGFRHTS